MTMLNKAGVTPETYIYTRMGYVPIKMLNHEPIWNSTDWFLTGLKLIAKDQPVWRVVGEYPSGEQRLIDCCATQLFHLEGGLHDYTYEAQELYPGIVLSSPLMPDYTRKPKLKIVEVEQLERTSDMYYISDAYRTVMNGFLLATKPRKG